VPLPGDGTIDVSWSIEPDSKTMQLKVRAPSHVEVEARLPDAYEGSVDIVSVGKSASVSEG
jgi:hypothetical protein